MSSFMSIYTHAHTHTHIHNTHIHNTHTHTFTHTHTHTHMPTDFTIQSGDTERLTLETGRNYTFLVNATGKWQNDTYSGFVFQLHTQRYDITLANTSACSNVECQTTGRNIGMVQLWTKASSTFLFYASTACSGNCSDRLKMPVLVAAVAIPVYGEYRMVSNFLRSKIVTVWSN